MLFYIDEFPERLHHPKESNMLFPKVVKLTPKVMGAVGCQNIHLVPSVSRLCPA